MHVTWLDLLRKMKGEELHTYVVRFVGPILTLPAIFAFAGDMNAVIELSTLEGSIRLKAVAQCVVHSCKDGVSDFGNGRGIMLVQSLAKLLNNEWLAQRLGIVDVGCQPAFDEADGVFDLQ